MDREQIIKALECFHARILNTKLAEKVTESEMMAVINAITAIKELTEEKAALIEEMALLFKGIIQFDIALTDDETNYICERIDEIVEEMLEGK